MIAFQESMVTPESIQALWALMGKQFGTKVIKKDDSELMAVVGTFLGGMGILNKEEFLKWYTTTVNKDIYTPFTVGVETEHFSLWHQALTCAHENGHAVQAEREGFPIFAVKYLGSDDVRAVTYEAPCYRTAMELEFWRYGFLPTEAPAHYADLLKNYNCGAAAIAAAQEALEIAKEDIQAGNIVEVTSIAAINWFKSFR